MHFSAITVAALTYPLMLAAYLLPRKRNFHVFIMASIMIFDLSLPIYLYLHRDWWHRLIDEEEIFSSLMWMHIGLFGALYALYFNQVKAAFRILKGDNGQRKSHRSLGKFILIVRAFVLLSGVMLAP